MASKWLRIYCKTDNLQRADAENFHTPAPTPLWVSASSSENEEQTRLSLRDLTINTTLSVLPFLPPLPRKVQKEDSYLQTLEQSEMICLPSYSLLSRFLGGCGKIFMLFSLLLSLSFGLEAGTPTTLLLPVSTHLLLGKRSC